MSDDDDDQSPQDGRQRAHFHAQRHKRHRYHQFNQWLSKSLILKLIRMLTDWEVNEGLDRVSEHSHMHLHVPMRSDHLGTTKSRGWPLNIATKEGRRVHKDKKEKKTTTEVKKPNDLPKAKKHEPMDSDEDDEVPQTNLELNQTLSLRYLCYLSNQVPEEEIQWVDRSNQQTVHKVRRPIQPRPVHNEH